MKKYITLNNLAWALAFLVPFAIATMLCTACSSLHGKTTQNQKQMHEEVRAMFAHVEKPL